MVLRLLLMALRLLLLLALRLLLLLLMALRLMALRLLLLVTPPPLAPAVLPICLAWLRVGNQPACRRCLSTFGERSSRNGWWKPPYSLSGITPPPTPSPGHGQGGSRVVGAPNMAQDGSKSASDSPR